jgi:hypothetical protein
MLLLIRPKKLKIRSKRWLEESERLPMWVWRQCWGIVVAWMFIKRESPPVF